MEDGIRRYFIVTATPLVGPDGTVNGICPACAKKLYPDNSTLRIVLGIHLLSDVGATPNSGKRGELVEGIRSAMLSYERVLHGLRDGDPALGLEPVHRHDLESRSHLDRLTSDWEDAQKPLMASTLAAPGDRSQSSFCRECHAVTKDQLAKVDRLVASLEHHYADKLKTFARAR